MTTLPTEVILLAPDIGTFSVVISAFQLRQPPLKYRWVHPGERNAWGEAMSQSNGKNKVVLWDASADWAETVTELKSMPEALGAVWICLIGTEENSMSEPWWESPIAKITLPQNPQDASCLVDFLEICQFA
jgi:hypothetical protein